MADVSIQVEGGTLPATDRLATPRRAVVTGHALDLAVPLARSAPGQGLAVRRLPGRAVPGHAPRRVLRPRAPLPVAVPRRRHPGARHRLATAARARPYWVPFFLLWVAYDLIRGQADNGRAVHITGPIDRGEGAVPREDPEQRPPGSPLRPPPHPVVGGDHRPDVHEPLLRRLRDGRGAVPPQPGPLRPMDDGPRRAHRVRPARLLAVPDGAAVDGRRPSSTSSPTSPARAPAGCTSST